jgi:hypothetical protein
MDLNYLVFPSIDVHELHNMFSIIHSRRMDYVCRMDKRMYRKYELAACSQTHPLEAESGFPIASYGVDR